MLSPKTTATSDEPAAAAAAEIPAAARGSGAQFATVGFSLSSRFDAGLVQIWKRPGIVPIIQSDWV